LPPDLAAATQATRYLCIRASGTSGWRDEPQLYHRLLPLPQEKNNVTGLPFLVAQISFISDLRCFAYRQMALMNLILEPVKK
jgi:hypothetical protein